MKIQCFKFKDNRKGEDKPLWAIHFRWSKLSRKCKENIFQKDLRIIKEKNHPRKVKNKVKGARNIKDRNKREEDREVEVLPHQIRINRPQIDKLRDNAQENINEDTNPLRVIKKLKWIQTNQNSLNCTSNT